MALGYLPLPEAMMIGYAAPLMVVALSAIILAEVVRDLPLDGDGDRLHPASRLSCGRA